MVTAVLFLVLIADDIPDVFTAGGSREIVIIEFKVVSVRWHLFSIGRKIEFGNGFAHSIELLEPLGMSVLDCGRHDCGLPGGCGQRDGSLRV